MNMREHTTSYRSPFVRESDIGRVHQLFGAELPKVLEAMNRELAA